SSARVSAYSPFGPDLPKGVRTPSTNTTSREEGTDSLLVAGQLAPLCYWSVTTAHARLAHRPARRVRSRVSSPLPRWTPAPKCRKRRWLLVGANVTLSSLRETCENSGQGWVKSVMKGCTPYSY